MSGILFTVLIYLFVILLSISGVYFLYRQFLQKRFSHKGKTVFLSGASEGIGKVLANILIKEGVKTLILCSRSLEKLKIVKSEIEKFKKENQTILLVPCDVSNKNLVSSSIDELFKKNIEIDFLYLLHGVSIPKYFLEQPEEEFEKQINVNYMGCVYLIKKILPQMIKREIPCHIILTGSAVSFCTFIGYSSYSPSKYAVRALAESLHNEFHGHPINIHLICPADTKTPGYEIENATKPIECVKMSETNAVYEPEDVVNAIIDGVQRGEFYIANDLLTKLLISQSRGLGPRKDPIFDFFKAPILSIVSSFIYFDWRSTSTKYSKERKERFKKWINNE